ncbi:unnamed protein product [Spirodela intermedia]|uniref:protein-serine/threonine phosphatase n=1 Tax=Spirodela intermedia TaxID=51605 RepID=A0A7I8ICU7_SPIIN|nr:unnamed protein product [Spirodela intermedia]CAA6655479.1 unnamed protein product [Spirodela intermedia]
MPRSPAPEDRGAAVGGGGRRRGRATSAGKPELLGDGGGEVRRRRGRQEALPCGRSNAFSCPPLPPVVPSPASSSASVSNTGELVAPDVPSTRRNVPSMPRPEFGFVSLSGRSREMEDAVSLHPCFYSPGDDCSSPLHFFAVFDGHGGSHVSALCKERMHVFLAEELQKASSNFGESQITVDVFTEATMRTFRRMDELALASCACGSVGEPSCGCDQAGFSSQIVGSTAVVAVVDRHRVFIANCGDSRAVLSRGGRAAPLSSDHKPDRPDEMARIEAAGGRVIYVNGARVLGILAMSRAIGDKYLKPIVISDPEIRVRERTPEDEFLIIASDGMWDVLSNDLACDIVRRCLRDERRQGPAEDLRTDRCDGGAAAAEHANPGASYCSMAATLLTRLALGRQSSDNISVIVVDLRRA